MLSFPRIGQKSKRAKERYPVSSRFLLRRSAWEKRETARGHVTVIFLEECSSQGYSLAETYHVTTIVLLAGAAYVVAGRSSIVNDFSYF